MVKLCCGQQLLLQFPHSAGAGCCVGSKPNRRLVVVRSLLNLSSGEKRAGCALIVGEPSGAVFCIDHKSYHAKRSRSTERLQTTTHLHRPKQATSKAERLHADNYGIGATKKSFTHNAYLQCVHSVTVAIIVKHKVHCALEALRRRSDTLYRTVFICLYTLRTTMLLTAATLSPFCHGAAATQPP